MTELVLAIGGTVVVLVCLVGVGYRVTNRTWTDEEYEERRQAGTTVGNMFLSAQAIIDPGAQAALEQRTVEKAENIESGGEREPGDGLSRTH
jgi:hypothetical protein